MKCKKEITIDLSAMSISLLKQVLHPPQLIPKHFERRRAVLHHMYDDANKVCD